MGVAQLALRVRLPHSRLRWGVAAFLGASLSPRCSASPAVESTIELLETRARTDPGGRATRWITGMCPGSKVLTERAALTCRGARSTSMSPRNRGKPRARQGSSHTGTMSRSAKWGDLESTLARRWTRSTT